MLLDEDVPALLLDEDDPALLLDEDDPALLLEVDPPVPEPSAWAIPDPLATAAPRPSVMAPVPSQVDTRGWFCVMPCRSLPARACFALARF